MSKSHEWFSQNFLENLEALREQQALQAMADSKNSGFLRKNHLLPRVASQSEPLLLYRSYADVFGARANVGPELIEEQLEDIKHHGKNIAALLVSKSKVEAYTDKPNPKLIRIIGRTLLQRNEGYIVAAERFESTDPRVQPHGILAGTVLLKNGALRNYSIGVNKSDVPADAGL